MSLLLSLLTSATYSSHLQLGPEVHIQVECSNLFSRWDEQGIENAGNLDTVFSKSGNSTSYSSFPDSTWDDMWYRANSGASHYQFGKTNVLITGETTNQIYKAGSSVDETKRKAQRYISAQKAAHPDWIILLVGTIPRADLATEELNRAANSKLLEIDEYQRTHLADIGAHGFVDLRADVPEWFDLRSDGVTAPFMDSIETCNSDDGITPDRVHPVGAPRLAYVHAIANALSQLPDRP